jgi:phenylacetate-CoA ligase
MTLYPLLFERGLLPLADRFLGSEVSHDYRRLLETEYAGREILQEINRNKLRDLLRFCRERVPFYRDLFQRHGIDPSRVEETSKLGSFPPLDKPILQEAYRQGAIFPEGKSLPYVTTTTSGSTGHLFTYRRSMQEFSLGWASAFRHMRMMGLRPGDRTLQIWANPLYLSGLKTFRKRLESLLLRRRTIPAFAIDSKRIKDYVELIERFRPAYIRGYAINVFEMCRMMEQAGARPRHAPRAISLTAEKATPEQKRQIGRVLNAPVFDIYAGGEILGLSYDCERHRGFHVTEGRACLEVLLDDGSIAPVGEGSLLVTNLDSFAMPLIRYNIGDRVVLTDERCPCGRNQPIIQDVIGRINDVIRTPDGRSIHSDLITHTIFESDLHHRMGILRYQAHQPALDRIDIQLQLHPGAPPPGDENTAQLERRIARLLPGIHIRTVFVSELPLDASGKHKYFTSDLPSPRPEHKE